MGPSTNRNLIVVACLASAAMAGWSPAQTTAPATTQATTRPVGRASPVEVLVTQYTSLLRGDVPGLRECFQASGADEQALLDAYLAMARSLRAVRQASETKFGRGSFPALGIQRSIEVEIRKLASAKMKEDGQATLIYANGESKPPLVLVRQPDRTWQISIARSFRNPARQADVVNAQAKLYDELAVEILDGKHATVARAAQARVAKLQAARKPTSGPTTQPDEP